MTKVRVLDRCSIMLSIDDVDMLIESWLTVINRLLAALYKEPHQLF